MKSIPLKWWILGLLSPPLVWADLYTKVLVSRRMYPHESVEVVPGFFNLLKGAEFGTRAQVEVTNTAKYPRIPGFAVAVLDKDGKLLGVASGGTKFGTVKPGETETFDLNFTQVKERLPLGASFVLSVELRD